jgi:RimJ/RimL family protein N-acetyltransferase
MSDEAIINKPSFSAKIDRSNWNLHLNSHSLFIRKLKKFFESFDLPLLADKFMGIIRWKCFTHAGAQSKIEELQINFSAPDEFQLKIVFTNLEQKFSQNYSLTISEILAWPISHNSLLTTPRLELRLLLPSDEPEIIEILRDPEVWKMRGEPYSPVENIYSVYPNEKEQFPWYKYYFVVQLSQNKQAIGFIGFSQISQPSLITPLINQTPYQSVMLSYGLSKHYWGKGLMFEAVSACVPWFVKNQNVPELIAFAEVKNQASRRILHKLGLQECGVLENAMISADADLKDIYQFMIYKS